MYPIKNHKNRALPYAYNFALRAFQIKYYSPEKGKIC